MNDQQRFSSFNLEDIVLDIELSDEQKDALKDLSEFVNSKLNLILDTKYIKPLDENKSPGTESLLVLTPKEFGSNPGAEPRTILNTNKNPLLILQSAIESIDIGVLVVDKDSKVSMFNQCFLKLWNITVPVNKMPYNDDKLIELVLEQLKDPDKFLKDISKIYSNPELEVLDFLELKDGKTFERTSKPQILDNTIIGRVWCFKDITKNKSIENELKKVNYMFEAILDSLDRQAFWSLDAKSTNFLYISSGIEKIYGISRDEFKKNPNLWRESTHPEDIHILDEVEKLTYKGIPTTYEIRIIRNDGDVRVLNRHNTPILDSDGNLLYLNGMTVDITVQKEIEEKLQEREKQLMEAQSIAHMGSWEWDIAKNKHSWSNELYKIYGLIPNEFEVSLEYFLESIHHEDFETAISIIEFAMINPEPFEFSTRIIRNDKTVRYLNHKGKAILGENGNVIKLIGVSHDITEQKNAEIRVYEQAALLDKAQDAIIVRDLDYNVIYWNKSAERLYGWIESEVMENNITEHLYIEKTNELITAQESILENGEWIGELNQLTKNGEEIIVQSRWTLIHDEFGSPKSILTVNTDITEKKKLEAQFYRSQRLESINTLTSGIAHDLNNILAPVMMAIHMLRMNLPEEKRNNILQTLEKSVKRGSDIIKQLLIFGKGVEGNKVIVDLNQLVLEMEKMLKETFPKSIIIEINLDNLLWQVSGDNTQLQQVLLNLFVNARDAMPDGGTLKVITENIIIDTNYIRMNPDAKIGPFVCITVRDTGVGISQKIIDKIFEPFFTTKELGTGLGLSTLIGIVKNHGGFVIVYSELDKGTEFKVFIPAIASKPNDEQIPKIDESDFSRGNGELIMVVDDEDSILEIVQHILTEAGYKVITANNGAEALEKFNTCKTQIKIIITDINMPVMNGLSLIETLYKTNPDMICIASSGLLMSSNNFDLKTFDIKAFLQKPYTAENLLKNIYKVLKNSKAKYKD